MSKKKKVFSPYYVSVVLFPCFKLGKYNRHYPRSKNFCPPGNAGPRLTLINSSLEILPSWSLSMSPNSALMSATVCQDTRLDAISVEVLLSFLPGGPPLAVAVAAVAAAASCSSSGRLRTLTTLSPRCRPRLSFSRDGVYIFCASSLSPFPSQKERREYGGEGVPLSRGLSCFCRSNHLSYMYVRAPPEKLDPPALGAGDRRHRSSLPPSSVSLRSRSCRGGGGKGRKSADRGKKVADSPTRFRGKVGPLLPTTTQCF